MARRAVSVVSHSAVARSFAISSAINAVTRNHVGDQLTDRGHGVVTEQH